MSRDPRNALRALEVAAVKAGLPANGLHTLRHSAASVMFTHGVPLEVVSEILGHSSIPSPETSTGRLRPMPRAVRWTFLGAAFGE